MYKNTLLQETWTIPTSGNAVLPNQNIRTHRQIPITISILLRCSNFCTNMSDIKLNCWRNEWLAFVAASNCQRKCDNKYRVHKVLNISASVFRNSFVYFLTGRLILRKATMAAHFQNKKKYRKFSLFVRYRFVTHPKNNAGICK